MRNQERLNMSYTDFNLIGEGLAYKKCFKLPPIFNSRSKSFVTELSEVENHMPKRVSVLEKRSPNNSSLMVCRSSVDEIGPIEDSENETIYAVSEASNASMEQTPIKINLEPMLSKKQSNKNRKKIRKIPMRGDVRAFRNQSSFMSGTISSEYKS